MGSEAAEKKDLHHDREHIEKLLGNAGFDKGEIDRFFDADPKDRTDMLIDRYDPELGGRKLGSLLKLVRREGDPEKVADFYVDVIKGEPVPAQLLVLHTAGRPEWRKFDKIDKALKDYQCEFTTLTQAWSYYEDKEYCGCDRRECM